MPTSSPTSSNGRLRAAAELDATAKQAVHESVFGRETDRECGDDHMIRASGAMERVHRGRGQVDPFAGQRRIKHARRHVPGDALAKHAAGVPSLMRAQV